jgi:hypothetical protein
MPGLVYREYGRGQAISCMQSFGDMQPKPAKEQASLR